MTEVATPPPPSEESSRTARVVEAISGTLKGLKESPKGIKAIFGTVGISMDEGKADAQDAATAAAIRLTGGGVFAIGAYAMDGQPLPTALAFILGTAAAGENLRQVVPSEPPRPDDIDATKVAYHLEDLAALDAAHPAAPDDGDVVVAMASPQEEPRPKLVQRMKDAWNNRNDTGDGAPPPNPEPIKRSFRERVITSWRTGEVQQRYTDPTKAETTNIPPALDEQSQYRATDLVRAKDYDGAIHLFEMIDGDTPKDSEVWFKHDFAKALIAKGGDENWIKAGALLDKAREEATTPDEQEWVTVALAELDGRIDDYASALTRWKAVEGLNPDNTEITFLVQAKTDKDGTIQALHDEGTAKIREGKFEEGLLDEEKALALGEGALTTDQLKWAQFNKGIALMRLGITEAAVAELLTAKTENRENTWVNSGLGLALEQSGNTEEALAHFRDALRIDPTNTEAEEGIARLTK